MAERNVGRDRWEDVPPEGFEPLPGEERSAARPGRPHAETGPSEAPRGAFGPAAARGEGRGGEAVPGPEVEQPSITELIGRLGRDTTELIRQEVNLARLEMKETAQEFATNLGKVAVAAGLAAAGGLSLTAFLVIVVGNALGGAYWAGALIVGVVFLGIGALLVNNARRNLRAEELKPERTIETIRENRDWARDEVDEFRRDIRH